MGERTQEPEPLDDFFEPALGDLAEELIEELVPVRCDKQRLVRMRRLAEQRLEEKRLRDELGDYHLQLDDF